MERHSRYPRAALAATALLGAIAAPLACGDEGEQAVSDAGDIEAGALDNAQPIDAGPIRAPFGLDARPANPTCRAPARPPSDAPVILEQVYENLNLLGAMVMAEAPGDKTRWFIAFRDGRIASIPKTNPTALTTVADLGALAGIPVNTDGEGGLLGFAFHPKFAQNGRLYVSWTTNPDGPLPARMRSRVGFLTSADGGATFTTYTNILGFDSRSTGHKGGTVAFGRDGLLYGSFGDGDDEIQGQNPELFFSKLLRIDVDGPNSPGLAYKIPPDNPFANGGGEPAAFAYGFRNPFRFSVDRDTGDIWLADVGAKKLEEINIVKSGGNYGWSCMEGDAEYWGPLAPYCPKGLVGLSGPLATIAHPPGVSPSRSITGGVVYRGKAIPNAVGSYFFGDYITQEISVLRLDPSTGTPKTTVLNGSGPVGRWVSFNEDGDGEVYVVSLVGAVYKLVVAPGAPPVTFPDRLSKTGCVDASDVKRPSSGAIPFAVNAELWADGAKKSRWLAIPDGQTIGRDGAGDFDLPSGSVLMKTFSLGEKRIETRLFVHHDDGGWAGYSYEWLDDESDAVLLPSSKRKKVGGVDWYFPSRGECLHCHTSAAGFSLGLEVGQLNGEILYPTTNRISNQLATLEHIGVLTTPVGPPANAPLVPTIDGTAPLDARARAYLHANCSMCHRPQGGGRGPADLRFTNDLAATKTCNVEAESGNLGIEGAKLVVPGAPGKSLVSIRAHATDARRMPPLATGVVDTNGLGVIDAWITALAGCP